MSIKKFDARGYLKKLYAHISNDTAEIFEGYKVRQLRFNNSYAYYAEFLSLIDSKRYLAFSMYIESEGDLIDLSLKALEREKDIYYNHFQNMLWNYTIEGKNLFDKKVELDEISTIRLEDL